MIIALAALFSVAAFIVLFRLFWVSARPRKSTVVVTTAVVVLLLAGRKAGLGKAAIMMFIYAVWMTWIADSAFHFGIF